MQVYVAGNAGLDWKAGSEIPAGEVERGADNQVRDLGYSLCGDECQPVVCLGLLLSGLEDVAVLQEEGLHLVDAPRGDEDEVDWPVSLVLKIILEFLQIANSRSCMSNVPFPIFQKVKPLNRAAKICRMILFHM